MGETANAQETSRVPCCALLCRYSTRQQYCRYCTIAYFAALALHSQHSQQLICIPVVYCFVKMLTSAAHSYSCALTLWGGVTFLLCGTAGDPTSFQSGREARQVRRQPIGGRHDPVRHQIVRPTGAPQFIVFCRLLLLCREGARISFRFDDAVYVLWRCTDILGPSWHLLVVADGDVWVWLVLGRLSIGISVLCHFGRIFSIFGTSRKRPVRALVSSDQW